MPNRKSSVTVSCVFVGRVSVRGGPGSVKLGGRRGGADLPVRLRLRLHQ